MAGTLNRKDPTGEIVKHMLPAGTAGAAAGTLWGPPVTVRLTLSATSTATAQISWINPEAGTVLANVAYVVTGSAGTGTVDVGRGTDGTGSASDIIVGGTLTAGYHERLTFVGTAVGSFTLGNVSTQWLLYGPGGTGTNNSVVGRVVDTTTSTMGGIFALVTYYRVS